MNKYQLMSDFELNERIECLQQAKALLTNYSHVFHADDLLSKQVQTEIDFIAAELEERGY